MFAVGIDPSLTSTGLAAVSASGHAFSFAVRPADARGVPRLIAIRDAVAGWIRRHAPAAVAMEGYSMAPHAGRLADLGELGGVLKLALWEMNYREDAGTLIIVPPTLLKKFATGTGNGDKGAVRVAVYKRWGFEAPTDDETDAYVLARIALAAAGGDVDLTAFQQQTLERILRGKAGSGPNRGRRKAAVGREAHVG